MAQGEELGEELGARNEQGGALRRAAGPIAAFITIASVAVAGFLGVSALVQRGTDLGYDMNVAARQRMLATRAAFFAHTLSDDGQTGGVSASKLRETLEVMEHSYLALRDGGVAPGLAGGTEVRVRRAPPTVQKVFRDPPVELGAVIEQFVEDGRRIADRAGDVSEHDRSIDAYVTTMEGPLLDGIEESLRAYEGELVRATHHSRMLTAGAVGAVVLVLTAVVGVRSGRRRASAARRQAEADVLREQKERYHALFEHSSDIVVITDEHGKVLDVSSSVSSVLGVADALALGSDVIESVHPDEREAMREAYRHLVEQPGGRAEVEVRVERPDGSLRTLHVVGHNLTHVPSVAGVVLNCHDITERRAAEAEQRATEARFRAAAEGSFDSFGILEPFRDGDGRVVDYVFVEANSRFAEKVGRPRDEVIGRRMSEVTPLSVELGLVERYAAVAESDVSATEEVLFAGSGRESTWYELTMVPLAGGVAVTARDITARKREQEELHYRAHHDVLTGLPNRAVLLDRLEYVLSGGGDPRVAVLFVDLDGFKEVNDVFGHEGGDTMLRQVADRLRTAVRAGDTVTRLGGDEFVVLCERVREVGEADDVASRVVEALHRPFPLGTERVSIGASVGVAIADPGISADLLLRNADNAVYSAKRHGGGCVVRYSPQSRVEREPVRGA